jgi:TRAP-type uncharacterized transport system substrate-binding protein
MQMSAPDEECQDRRVNVGANRRWASRSTVPPRAVIFSYAALAAIGCTGSPERLRLVGSSTTDAEQAVAMILADSTVNSAQLHLELVTLTPGRNEALDALDRGDADLAIVENDFALQRPALRTVRRLYPSVLHIAYRGEGEPQTFRELLMGAKVFAGEPGSAARTLLERLRSLYGLSVAEIDYVNTLDDVPDVVVLFAPIAPSRLRLFPNYRLFSLGRPQTLDRGSVAEAASLLFPQLRPFIIPVGTYGDATPSPVVTVAVDTLLVGHGDLSRVLVFDLLAELASVSSILVPRIPGFLIDPTEDPGAANLVFPMHSGADAYQRRNDPGFFERSAELLDALFAVSLAVLSALLATWRFVRSRRRRNGDELYAEILRQRLALRGNANENAQQHAAQAISELQDRAIQEIIDGRRPADENFRVFLTLSNHLLQELNDTRVTGKSQRLIQ